MSTKGLSTDANQTTTPRRLRSGTHYGGETAPSLSLAKKDSKNPVRDSSLDSESDAGNKGASGKRTEKQTNNVGLDKSQPGSKANSYAGTEHSSSPKRSPKGQTLKAILESIEPHFTLKGKSSSRQKCLRDLLDQKDKENIKPQMSCANNSGLASSSCSPQERAKTAAATNTVPNNHHQIKIKVSQTGGGLGSKGTQPDAKIKLEVGASPIHNHGHSTTHTHTQTTVPRPSSCSAVRIKEERPDDYWAMRQKYSVETPNNPATVSTTTTTTPNPKPTKTSVELRIKAGNVSGGNHCDDHSQTFRISCSRPESRHQSPSTALQRPMKPDIVLKVRPRASSLSALARTSTSAQSAWPTDRYAITRTSSQSKRAPGGMYEVSRSASEFKRVPGLYGVRRTSSQSSARAPALCDVSRTASEFKRAPGLYDINRSAFEPKRVGLYSVSRAVPEIKRAPGGRHEERFNGCFKSLSAVLQPLPLKEKRGLHSSSVGSNHWHSSAGGNGFKPRYHYTAQQHNHHASQHNMHTHGVVLHDNNNALILKRPLSAAKPYDLDPTRSLDFDLVRPEDVVEESKLPPVANTVELLSEPLEHHHHGNARQLPEPQEHLPDNARLLMSEPLEHHHGITRLLPEQHHGTMKLPSEPQEQQHHGNARDQHGQGVTQLQEHHPDTKILGACLPEVVDPCQYLFDVQEHHHDHVKPMKEYHYHDTNHVNEHPDTNHVDAHPVTSQWSQHHRDTKPLEDYHGDTNNHLNETHDGSDNHHDTKGLNEYNPGPTNNLNEYHHLGNTQPLIDGNHNHHHGSKLLNEHRYDSKLLNHNNNNNEDVKPLQGYHQPHPDLKKLNEYHHHDSKQQLTDYHDDDSIKQFVDYPPSPISLHDHPRKDPRDFLRHDRDPFLHLVQYDVHEDLDGGRYSPAAPTPAVESMTLIKAEPRPDSSSGTYGGCYRHNALPWEEEHSGDEMEERRKREMMLDEEEEEEEEGDFVVEASSSVSPSLATLTAASRGADNNTTEGPNRRRHRYGKAEDEDDGEDSTDVEAGQGDGEDGGGGGGGGGRKKQSGHERRAVTSANSRTSINSVSCVSDKGTVRHRRKVRPSRKAKTDRRWKTADLCLSDEEEEEEDEKGDEDEDDEDCRGGRVKGRGGQHKSRAAKTGAYRSGCSSKSKKKGQGKRAGGQPRAAGGGGGRRGRKALEVEALWSDPQLDAHAFLLWASENRREVEKQNRDAAASEVETVLTSRWRHLPFSGKLQFFCRARDATSEYNGKLTARQKKKAPPACGTKDPAVMMTDGSGGGTSTVYEDFLQLPQDRQKDLLRKWLRFFQKMLPRLEYQDLISDFKRACKSLQLRHVPARRKNARLRNLDPSHYHMLFEKIRETRPRVMRVYNKRKTREDTLLRQSFSAMVRRLVAGHPWPFVRGCRSKLLGELLKDIQQLEVEEVLAQIDLPLSLNSADLPDPFTPKDLECPGGSLAVGDGDFSTYSALLDRGPSGCCTANNIITVSSSSSATVNNSIHINNNSNNNPNISIITVNNNNNIIPTASNNNNHHNHPDSTITAVNNVHPHSLITAVSHHHHHREGQTRKGSTSKSTTIMALATSNNGIVHNGSESSPASYLYSSAPSSSSSSFVFHHSCSSSTSGSSSFSSSSSLSTPCTPQPGVVCCWGGGRGEAGGVCWGVGAGDADLPDSAVVSGVLDALRHASHLPLLDQRCLDSIFLAPPSSSSSSHSLSPSLLPPYPNPPLLPPPHASSLAACSSSSSASRLNSSTSSSPLSTSTSASSSSTSSIVSSASRGQAIPRDCQFQNSAAYRRTMLYKHIQPLLDSRGMPLSSSALFRSHTAQYFYPDDRQGCPAPLPSSPLIGRAALPLSRPHL